MEQYLQIYYFYLQNNWEKWLPLTKFTANNIINKLTGITPFYIIYRQDAYLRFKLRPKINTIGPMIKQIQLIDIYNFVD